MRKIIATTAVAASLAAGGVAGALVGAPSLAGAAETATGAVGWVEDALKGLVDTGTITQAQADAVETALEEARPARPPRGFGRHLGMDAVAQALGMSNTELRDALESGKTIAAVAGERNVAVEAVVDAIVAAEKAHVDQHVASGDITQAQADERLANARERATDLVNREGPPRRR